MALQGGSSVQTIKVSEIYIAGLASALAPMSMIAAWDSTVGVTLSGTITNTAKHPNTSALSSPPTAFSTASTDPQRSATLIALTLGFNALGGITRWQAMAPDDVFEIFGNAASVGEFSISAGANSTASTPVDSYMVYEPL